MKKNATTSEFYQWKAAQRKVEAKRPVAEKLATVRKLREVQENLAPTREANKAARAARRIKIAIKTR